MLNQAGETGGVAGPEFAGGHGFVEEFLCLPAKGAELGKRDGVEVWVG